MTIGKFSPQEIVQGMKRTVGVEKAMYIAKRTMENIAPSEWKSLPTGPVFGTKRRNGKEHDLNVKYLQKQYEVWTHVFYILKKESKRKV